MNKINCFNKITMLVVSLAFLFSQSIDATAGEGGKKVIQPGIGLIDIGDTLDTTISVLSEYLFENVEPTRLNQNDFAELFPALPDEKLEEYVNLFYFAKTRRELFPEQCSDFEIIAQHPTWVADNCGRIIFSKFKKLHYDNTDESPLFCYEDDEWYSLDIYFYDNQVILINLSVEPDGNKRIEQLYAEKIRVKDTESERLYDDGKTKLKVSDYVYPKAKTELIWYSYDLLPLIYSSCATIRAFVNRSMNGF
jgi:hypothetical protein